MTRPRPPFVLAAAGLATIALATGAFLLVRGDGGGEPDGGAEPVVPPAERLKTGETFFGMNDSLLYTSAQFNQDDLSREHVAAMAASGVEWVRFSAAWRGEEPTPPFEGQHRYDFQFLDRVVGLLAEEELAMEITLVTTPVWAADATNAEGCTANVNPRAPAFGDFAAYGKAIVERYGSGGSFWSESPDLPVAPLRSVEIWNEPNWNAFWCPAPEPEQYAELFVAAAEAIREADPRVAVVIGGLTSVFADDVEAVARGMDATEFVARMMEHRPQIDGLADAVGFHPYDVDVDGVAERIARFRRGLDASGLKDVPIEVNEAGWPTQGPAYPTPETQRAELVAELADAVWGSGCDVAGLALYAWRTPEMNPAASEDFYGMADPESAEAYESARAYAEQIATLREAGRRRTGPC